MHPLKMIMLRVINNPLYCAQLGFPYVFKVCLHMEKSVLVVGNIVDNPAISSIYSVAAVHASNHERQLDTNMSWLHDSNACPYLETMQTA